ncbi:MAG: hypothetical protein WD270_09100 [Acetobacterales bacterium]
MKKKTGADNPATPLLTRERDHQPASSAPLRLFRLFEKPVHAVAWRLRLLEYALSALEREIKSTVRVPRRVRLRLWRRGLLSEAWVLYDLARNDPDLYLSDVERFVGTRLINGAHGVVLDDKLLLARLFDGPLARYAPPVLRHSIVGTAC